MFRFTIRDVLWLTVVAAIGLAMGVTIRAERAQSARLRLEALKYKEQLRMLADEWEKQMPETAERAKSVKLLSRRSTAFWFSRHSDQFCV